MTFMILAGCPLAHAQEQATSISDSESRSTPNGSHFETIYFEFIDSVPMPEGIRNHIVAFSETLILLEQRGDYYYFYLGCALSVISLLLLLYLMIYQRRAKISVENLASAEQKLEQYKKKLKDARDYQNTTLKSLGQDLRTPLNSIVGVIQLLKDSPLNTYQQHCMAMADVSCRTTLTLIDDIQDLTQLHEGKFALSEEVMDLSRLTEEVAQMFQPEYQNSAVDFICDIPSEPLPFYMGDPSRIQQILINLLSRAFQNTDQGEIVLKLEIDGAENAQSFAHFTVTDTGYGNCEVGAVELDNPLAHGHSILGLSVSKLLSEAMSGSMDVMSHTEEGTQIEILLPLNRAAHPAGLNREFTEFPHRKALIVSQQPTLSDLIERHLASWSVESEQVSAIREINEFIGSDQCYSVIILDSKNEKTATITRQIRKIREQTLPLIPPIIVITEPSNLYALDDADKHELSYLCPKPLLINDLHKCLSDAFTLKSPDISSHLKILQNSNFPVRKRSNITPDAGFDRLENYADSEVDTRMKILLAEDNLVNQKVTALLLKKMQLEIEIVSNGRDAVSRVEEGDIDLVLMDMKMPDLDGIQATRRIRQLEALTKQPTIIALTASTSPEDEISCKQAGMDNFLAKPIQYEKMKAALAFASIRNKRNSSLAA